MDEQTVTHPSSETPICNKKGGTADVSNNLDGFQMYCAHSRRDQRIRNEVPGSWAL